VHDKLIKLKLGGPSPDVLAGLRQMLERALELLRDSMAAADAPNGDDVRDRLEACRSALADASPLDRVEQLTGAALDLCAESLKQIGARQTERQREVAAVIRLVQEAMAAVTGDAGELHASVEASADRFTAIAALNDLAAVKRQLAQEVAALKQAVVERRKSWSETLTTFEQRVALLERELAATEKAAKHDSLTGIANRAVFERTCKGWIASSRSRFVLALFDVDNFKSINDERGHAAGDAALVFVAQALKTSMRSDDIVARLGGDEFVVLAAELTLRQAESRLGSLVTKIAGEAAPVPGSPLSIGLSCGVAEYSAGDTVESLLQRADEALYEAKRLGKRRAVAKARPFLRDLIGHTAS
jgi:diguanylate cyclase